MTSKLQRVPWQGKTAHASSEIEASSLSVMVEIGGFEDVGQEGCWASTFAYKN